MGPKQSKTIPYSSDFNISEWINQNYTANQNAVLEYGKMRTLKNRNTDQLIDKYQNAFISSKDYDDYIKSFEWRRHQNYIVRAYHVVTKNSSRYCSNTYHVDVYIQHPKNRLSDFSDIPFPDTLYCLKAMLTGYAKLYSNVGSFPVRQQQVCIDDKGNIRVWLNKDLSKNFPQQWQIQPRLSSNDQQEQDMVHNIVSIVARNSDVQLQPHPSFLNFFQKNKKTQKLGFDQTLMLVSQYAQLNNSNIPEYFTSVLQVYQNQDQLYQLQGGEQVNQSMNHQKNMRFQQFGQITQRQFNKNKASFRGSKVSKHTSRSHQSRDSKASEIDRLQKNHSRQGFNNLNDLNNSMRQNHNAGETYRLSNLSKLQDNNQRQTIGGERKNHYNHGHYLIPHLSSTAGVPNQNVTYRQSDNSNPNYSQISYNSGIKNQAPVWVSLKPEQPYIPSSQAYLHLKNEQTQPRKYLNQFSSPTVRTQQTDRNQIIQNSSNRNRNYSISEKAEQQNMSIDKSRSRGIEQLNNQRFQKQLENQLLEQQQALQRQNKINMMRGSGNAFKNSQNVRGSNFRNSKQNSQINGSLSGSKQGSRQGSISQLNQISNHPNTAQFIHPSQQFHRSLNHNASTSHIQSINKSRNQRGFTIVIKPNSVTSAAPISFNNFNNIPTSPQYISMLKNNSQPYFPTQPIYQSQQYAIVNSPMSSPRLNGQSSFSSSTFTMNINMTKQISAFSQQKIQSNKQNTNQKVQLYYCTVRDQVALDPQIVKDMLVYSSN